VCIAEINLHEKWAVVKKEREKGVGEESLLFVPKTETFDCVTLREPAHANVLVPVRGNDMRFVG
jgi:hypothetical protein